MKRHFRNRGQSFVLIAVVMAALVIFVGLVVDVGNAYAAQRRAQSAANAAAIAGTKHLALSRDNPGSLTDTDIKAEIDGIAIKNGFAPDDLVAEYLRDDGTVIRAVGTSGDVRPPEDAAYIRVRVNAQVSTYFVRVAGFDTIDVNAATQAHNIPAGAPGCTDDIYPIAVYRQDFERGEVYYIWDGDPNDPHDPGNFGWLRWRQDPTLGSTPELVKALTPPGTLADSNVGYFDGSSHILGPGKIMFGNTGLGGGQDVRGRLQWFINSGSPMILPLFTQSSGQGNNAIYINDGFAMFRLMDVCFHHNDCPDIPEEVPNSAKALKVTFLGYIVSGCTVSVPVSPGDSGGQQKYARALGDIILCQPQANVMPPDDGAHLPVDVMHLVDSSGSMGSPLVGGSGKSKIEIEKEALVYFNALMRVDRGDQLGAVKFHNYNQDVVPLSYLTTDIGYLNSRIQSLSATGWTPWAKAVLEGNKALFGPNRNPESKPVLIIASDGAPTVDLDNQANGNYQNLEWDAMSPGTLRYCYLKNSCSYPGCVPTTCPGPRKHDLDVEVLIDALDAADVVKGRREVSDTWWVIRHGGSCSNSSCPYYGVQPHPEMEIFVIAIKGQEEFSASVLKYVATDPFSEHYFEVYTEEDVKDIYTYIANAISGQLPYCYINYNQQTGVNLSMEIQVLKAGAVIGSGYPDAGAYLIDLIPVDPYETYDIVGNANYNGENYHAAMGCDNQGQIGVQMTQPGDYVVPLYLVPETEVECPEGTIEIPPP